MRSKKMIANERQTVHQKPNDRQPLTSRNRCLHQSTLHNRSHQSSRMFSILSGQPSSLSPSHLTPALTSSTSSFLLLLLAPSTSFLTLILTGLVFHNLHPRGPHLRRPPHALLNNILRPPLLPLRMATRSSSRRATVPRCRDTMAE